MAIGPLSESTEVALPLDSLLSPGSRTGLPDVALTSELSSWAAALARRPGQTTGRLLSLAGELTRIASGASDTAPSRRDRRFSDAAWSTNPILRRAVQAYLASSETAQLLLQDAEFDEPTRQKLQLLVDNVVDALAPSNNVFLNPEAAKAVVDTGGANLVHGARNLVSDLSSRPRVPSMVDQSQFTVGVNVAATPGAVVHRTPVLELIQFTPSTDEVHQTPLLIVPPTINKYYVLDLAPGRSLVEYLVSQGHQVFMVSWRNPTARHADWDLDTYIHGVVEALDVVRQVAGVEQAALFGTCSGGIIASMVAAYLAGVGRADTLTSLTLAVTVLDQSRGGTTTAFLDRKRAEEAVARSRRTGYLDGAILAEVFAWLRPNDLIWNYWVNNYLLGRNPPAFDILYWNADTTRMPAALHRDFLELSLNNKLVTPGDATALGIPVDLGKVTHDAFVIGGRNDHITPWGSCYRSAQLLGGRTDFVLSSSGHIAALVNPADNPKASFLALPAVENTADEYLHAATRHEGSWWPHYAHWLADRCGEPVPAASELGSAEYPVVAEAPGTYVFDA